MKITILQEDFLKGLLITSNFVSPHAQIPVLANILLSTKKGKLHLAATNLETGISYKIGAKIERQGQTTIPAKTIVDLVSNIPNSKIQLTETNNQISLKSNSVNATINGISAKEFPNVPDKISKETLFFPRSSIQQINKQVCFAAATDDTRPTLTGVLILFENNNLVTVATDGFRLSHKKITFNTNTQKPPKKRKLTSQKKQEAVNKLIIPAKSIYEVDKVIPQDEENINVSVLSKEGQILFSGESVVLTSKLLEGEFPDFGRIIPQKHTFMARFGKEDMVGAVKAASVFAREEASIVKLKINSGGVAITAESQQHGKDEIKIDAKTEGGEVEIAFNYKYVLDFLNSTGGEEVSFETEGPTSPGVFKDVKDTSYFHLIMPVRIQS